MTENEMFGWWIIAVWVVVIVSLGVTLWVV